MLIVNNYLHILGWCFANQKSWVVVFHVEHRSRWGEDIEDLWFKGTFKRAVLSEKSNVRIIALEWWRELWVTGSERRNQCRVSLNIQSELIVFNCKFQVFFNGAWCSFLEMLVPFRVKRDNNARYALGCTLRLSNHNHSVTNQWLYGVFILCHLTSFETNECCISDHNQLHITCIYRQHYISEFAACFMQVGWHLVILNLNATLTLTNCYYHKYVILVTLISSDVFACPFFITETDVGSSPCIQKSGPAHV